MKIELVYFHGCPNREPAERELRSALKQVALPTDFAIWESSDPHAPDYARRYGSPTVLLDGKDLFESEPTENPACRIYGPRGYPIAADIVENLHANPTRGSDSTTS